MVSTSGRLGLMDSSIDAGPGIPGREEIIKRTTDLVYKKIINNAHRGDLVETTLLKKALKTWKPVKWPQLKPEIERQLEP